MTQNAAQQEFCGPTSQQHWGLLRAWDGTLLPANAWDWESTSPVPGHLPMLFPQHCARSTAFYSSGLC